MKCRFNYDNSVALAHSFWDAQDRLRHILIEGFTNRHRTKRHRQAMRDGIEAYKVIKRGKDWTP
jgi:hypothetical protein